MSRYHKLRVKDVHKETDDAVVIEFEVPEGLREEFDFKPGQHIGIKTSIKGEDVRRSYSICAIPDDGILRIGVKHVPGGLFSSFAINEILPGDKLEILAPQGNFIHQSLNGKAQQYVFFAAGSGITPVISLVRSILASEPASEVILFYGNRTSETIMFRETLEALKNRYMTRLSVHHILSREQLNSDLNQGRIDAAKLGRWSKLYFSPEEVDKYFICGPEQMIMTVRDWLQQRGIDKSRIRFELFTTPTSKAFIEERTPVKHQVDPDSESKVTVLVDGASTDFVLPFNGPSILDAAMRSGADVPFSCKGGVCCTCKARLVEGEVDMDVVYGLETDEIEAGYILTCQSHPVTERVLVDYDV